MKKLITILAAALVIATTGCGTDSKSPLLTYVSRTQSDSYAAHLFTLTLKGSTWTSTAVTIPIPASAQFVAANSDATKVVYERNVSSGVYDIFLMGTDGTEKQLTTGLNAWAPVFSPDGKTIVFNNYVSSSGVQSMVTMNVDGSNQTALYAPASGIYPYYPQFSPDGKSIVFFLDVSGCCAPQHGRAASERTSRTPARNSYPTIAVHALVGPQVAQSSGWYTMALTDTTPTLVYATTSWWGPAVYSADGKKLLMTIYDGNQYNISSVSPLDGTGTASPLTTNTDTYSISPVPYKNAILFNRNNNTSSSWDIYVMDQTGANQTLVNSTTSTYETLIDSYWGD
jgi:Tol biopolymer transport system component